MKLLILPILLLTFSCTQKYKTYHAIQKRNFNYRETGNVPIMKKMYPGKKEVQQSCEGQVFFNRNAHTISINNIPAMLRYSCPDSEYLLNAKITETWWTTLVYSKSCIKIESYCPRMN